METGRRSFLRGLQPVPATPPCRPPWALDETAFRQVCSRCDRCLSACPTGLLRRGGGGYPEADFTAAHCTFCGDCRQACPSGALRGGSDTAPWLLTAVISEHCLAGRGIVCRTCGERCDAGAIAFIPQRGGVALPRLAAEACTGCGECVADCPSGAIAMRRPVVQPGNCS